MATQDVVAVGGKKSGSVELDPAVFEAPVRPHLFHAEVRRQLSARRAGTHSTKNRAGVSGGGAKPYRQKGTGRARQGTTRAPQFQGGGSVFGPVPRGHEHRLTKKTRRAALRSALSLRQSEGAVVVVEDPDFNEYKTRQVLDLLQGLDLGGESVLIVIPEPNPHLEVSARNLAKVGVVRVAGLNVYDVLRHAKLVLTQGAIPGIGARLGAGEASS